MNYLTQKQLPRRTFLRGVGATLALELAHHGVRACVVERATVSSPYPKMDFVNARSMELLQTLAVELIVRGSTAPPA